MAVCIQFLLLFLFLDLTRSQIRFPGSQGPKQSPRPIRPRPGQNTNNREDGLLIIGGSRPPTQSSSGKLQRNACNCFEARLCPPNKGQAKHGCLTEQNTKGICCVSQEGAITTRVQSFGNARPISIPENVITAGFESGLKIAKKIEKETQQNKRTGQFLRRNTPSRGHAYFFQRNPSAVAIHKEAYINARSSVEISRMQNLSPDEAFVSLNKVSISERTRRPCSVSRNPICDPSAKFRTIDGSCNNLLNPLFGSSETAFNRITPPQYEDGIMSPRSKSITGRNLPIVRDVSNIVLLDVNNPSNDLSLNVMQWAQFVDHDLTHAPFPDMDGEAIQCCEDGRPVRNMPEGCFNIPIARDDGFFSLFGQQCINFVRTMLALREKCSFGPAEQLNTVTHWFDGSMVYGSTAEEAERVRESLNSPLLAVSRNQLPPTDGTIDCESRSPASCFVAGDSRINEQAALTVMHTIWIREHNRIAKDLKRINPRWTSERIFQEARRIVIAEIQHITFTEWLPLIIGPDVYRKHRFGSNAAYNPSINPNQFNEFATGAFRFGHSLVQGVYKLPSRTGRISTLRLRDVFNDPGILQRDPELVDSFVRGLTTQEMQTLDNFITEELSNHLFETSDQNFGMDLMSLNLQRGRDHGIGNYNTLRRVLGSGPSNNFFDLKSTTADSLISRLQASYENAEDIDLFVGGMTETRLRGGLLGPTFAEIVALQFFNVKNGDRFFYDILNQPGSFTRAQLAEIQSSSMSRIFCDNSNVEEMQPNAFKLPDRQRNRKVRCGSNIIPKLDLNLWKH